jgi:hypothetical protein
MEREECQEVKPWRLPLSWSSAVLQDDEKDIIVNKLKLPFLPESSLAFLMPLARYRMTCKLSMSTLFAMSLWDFSEK